MSKNPEVNESFKTLEEYKEFFDNLHMRSRPPQDIMLLAGKQAISTLKNTMVNESNDFDKTADELMLFLEDIHEIVSVPH